jgi:hypothetical protein
MTAYDGNYRQPLEAYDAAVEAGRVDLDRDYRQQLHKAAGLEEAAQLARAGVRRSKLSAMQKSELIHRLGKAGYDSLPWA